MLVGKTERRDLPHEPGEWMEFRHLTGAELDEAKEEALGRRERRSLGLVRGLDPVALAAIRQEASSQQGAVQEAEAEEYDRGILVRYGVAGWSYQDECTLEKKAELDALTRDWAAGVVQEMNTRPRGEGTGSGGRSPGENSRRSLEEQSDFVPQA